jgi:proteasomal ATPase-associated factor 1
MRLEISHDWHTADSCWISSSSSSSSSDDAETTLHADVAKLSGGGWEVGGKDASWFEVERGVGDSIAVRCPRRSQATLFRAPQRVIDFSRQLLSADLASSGLLVAAGGVDGSLTIANASTGDEMLSLEGHLGDVNVAKFFPSSRVLLSGGSDMVLRVWSVEENDGRCAAILRGHTGGVLGVGMLDRGRNVVSCSRDGSVRLWDCSTSQTVSHWALSASSALNAICIVNNGTRSSPLTTEEGAVGGDADADASAIVFAAGEDGALTGLDLRSPSPALTLQSAGATAINCVTEFNAAAGHGSGGGIACGQGMYSILYYFVCVCVCVLTSTVSLQCCFGRNSHSSCPRTTT